MNLLSGERPRQERDGITAIFRNRVDADLAIERLSQEYGIDPAFIYAEPVAEANSAGLEPSGGDRASGFPSHGERVDAPLHGSIQVTLPVEHEDLAKLTAAMQEAGAIGIEVF